MVGVVEDADAKKERRGGESETASNVMSNKMEMKMKLKLRRIIIIIMKTVLSSEVILGLGHLKRNTRQQLLFLDLELGEELQQCR